jgi:hypothetical protein
VLWPAVSAVTDSLTAVHEEGDTMDWSREVGPPGNPAIPLEGMTVRDLIAELTWLQDHLRPGHEVRHTGASPLDTGLDETWLRRRESEICAELRRRHGTSSHSGVLPAADGASARAACGHREQLGTEVDDPPEEGPPVRHSGLPARHAVEGLSGQLA